MGSLPERAKREGALLVHKCFFMNFGLANKLLAALSRVLSLRLEKAYATRV